MYPDDLLHEIIEIARQHHLIIYADEVRDWSRGWGCNLNRLASPVLTITFNGLSKNYGSCGYRAGWLVVSGDKRHARITSRVSTCWHRCACAPYAGAAWYPDSLGRLSEYRRYLIKEGGRLRRQRDIAHQLISAIPGVLLR